MNLHRKKTQRIPLLILGIVFISCSCSGFVSSIQDELEGRIWLLTAINNKTPMIGNTPTIQFLNGRVSGTTGCNHYGGSYQVKGNKISFEELYSTEMACLEPEGLMDQERVYLELLGAADQYELNGDRLTIFGESNPILVFEIQPNAPVSTKPTLEPTNQVSADAVPIPITAPVFEPPEGFNPYKDPVTGTSVYIPANWIVTGIIEGQYAILQSYPEDKYIGGEKREEGDTKCDLNIRPPGTQVSDLINQWKSDSRTTIISENEFEFPNQVTGKRFEIDSLGLSTIFIAEINSRVVLLTCFGDFGEVDEIASTLQMKE